MKKTMKFLAVFALCVSVMANCLPIYAAASATIPCPNCGKTAFYSGSEVKGGKNIDKHKVKINGTDWDCYISDVDYEDTYRCGWCEISTRRSHTEKNVHSIAHN